MDVHKKGNAKIFCIRGPEQGSKEKVGQQLTKIKLQPYAVRVTKVKHGKCLQK